MAPLSSASSTLLQPGVFQQHQLPSNVLSALHTFVQTTDMAFWVASSMDHHCVGCFCVGPLQIVIDIGACPTVANVTSTGVYSWCLPGIRSQMTCTGKSLDITNLRENNHAENQGNSW